MNYIKTALLLVLLTTILIWIGGLAGGANGALVAFVISLVINGISYWFSDRIVLRMYRASELPREGHSELYSAVEEMSTNAGIPCPRIYIARMKTPNAFATGRDPEHGVLCLTEGIMNMLDMEELKGVVSHELAHIRNRDTLIMTVTAALASSVMMLAYMARWAAILGGMSRDRRDSGNIIGLIAVSIIAPFAAMLVQLAISRSREYAADAAGAGITGDPKPLARALEEMSASAKRSKTQVVPQTAHMFIVSPLRVGGIANLFSTHPPVAERVRRLRSM